VLARFSLTPIAPLDDKRAWSLATSGANATQLLLDRCDSRDS
jgi:hypothetical protein